QSSGMSTGVIAAIAVGIVCLVLLLGLVGCLVWRRRQRKEHYQHESAAVQKALKAGAGENDDEEGRP
ncbi:unnamed protein product, partial [Closterium sp. NIES-64]